MESRTDLGKVALVTGGEPRHRPAPSPLDLPRSAAVWRSAPVEPSGSRPRLLSCALSALRRWRRRADMTSDAGRCAVFDQTLGRFGQIDILINNVGGGGAPTFMEYADEQRRAAFDLTLGPSVRSSWTVAAQMKAQGGGAIIMISSIYGREWGGRPADQTVKAAENSLAKAMARELAPFNIRVNAVALCSIPLSRRIW